MEVMTSHVAVVRLLSSPLSTSQHDEYHQSSLQTRLQSGPGRRRLLLTPASALAVRGGFIVVSACGALRHHEGLRMSSSVVDVTKPLSVSDGFAVAVNSSLLPFARDGKKTVTSRGVVSAVFERFTERAIKSVMLAQREAKALGRKEVGTEQLLVGLIAEESGSKGYLGSGLTIDRARKAVKDLLEHDVGTGIFGPATEVPFSHGSKRVFEAALNHSKKMRHNYIAPEHVAVALLSVDRGGASKLLYRLGVKKDKLRTETVSKFQGELEKEGRSPASSVAMPAKAAAGATTSAKRIGIRKGSYILNTTCSI